MELVKTVVSYLELELQLDALANSSQSLTIKGKKAEAYIQKCFLICHSPAFVVIH